MELARQTHFRGYYLLNADIINLASSATGDFAFSAESGTVWMYESAWYDSGQLVPDQVTPASDELPLVNGEANAGISTSYSRGDHQHPQQLTYDHDITATKFIKTGGTATEILLANGDTTTIDSKISRTYSSGSGGYIRLCVFPAANSIGAPYIQFQVTCNTNAMQTIDLVPNYSVNGISALYGVFTAPSYVQTIYNVYYGVDQLLHSHTGTGSSAVYTAWIHMMSGSGSVTVTVSKQSSYWPTRVTEILTQDIVSSISGSQTQIPMTFNLGSGGIIGDMLQGSNLSTQYPDSKLVTNYVLNAGSSDSFAGVTSGNIKINPTATSYDDGLRISRSEESTGGSSLILGCSRFSNTGAIVGQWSIFTPPNSSVINPQGFAIAVSSQAGDNTRGLQISADGNTLTFNGRVL
ncbi:MAG: hypothetical protein EZS28_023719 [Streblomastix strix]|uniref:Uncharacterized protein n=1 Tax=Streblomastix strix TaxID=222440 RepID=A0A5J4VE36_9EUKA|nr:MAG: hypothetical protein EZS28_023719 [Streblomastix strix]